MRILTIFPILFIIILGCAVLNQPTFEVDSSKLTSITNPQLVDGNLETVSIFAVRGHLEKSYRFFYDESRPRGQTQRKYITQIEGSKRTEAVIKLDSPTYISYVEIYPASRIPKLALMTTLEDPPQFETSFDVVRDKQPKLREGKRTEAVIKLDRTYVEIYPASRIPKLALMTTLEDPPQFETSFDVVRDKQHINVEGKQPGRNVNISL